MNPDRLTQPANDAMVRFVEALTEPEAARSDDREARRRVPRVHPALHLGVHVPSQQHEPDHRRTHHPVAHLHPPGRVRRLARRRDAHPVAHRDTRRGRPSSSASGPTREDHARGRRHRRARLDRHAPPPPTARSQGVDHEEVLPRRRARSRRAVQPDHHARPDGRPAQRARRSTRGCGHASIVEPAGAQPTRRQRRRPCVDARHLRRRDPGARGCRANLSRLPHGRRPGSTHPGRGRRRRTPRHQRRGAVRVEARHGPPGLGRGAPRRDQREAQRLDGRRDRRVRREHRAVPGRVQHRPGACGWPA